VQSGVAEENCKISFQSHSQDVIGSIGDLPRGRNHLNRLQRSKITRSIQVDCNNFEKTLNHFVISECDEVVIGARRICSAITTIPGNLFGIIDGTFDPSLKDLKIILSVYD